MSADVATRPSTVRKWANASMAWFLRHGAGPSFLRLLTVTGRTTGRPRSTPVAPVRRDGHVWLVAPYGRVSWVRNLEAATRVELQRGRDRHTYDAREVNEREAVPVLRAYLSMPRAPFVRGEFEITSESSDEAIAAEAARHPV